MLILILFFYILYAEETDHVIFEFLETQNDWMKISQKIKLNF